MVLNDEQNGLFFDVMDSLLYYVNDRFRVVEGFTLEYSSPLDDVKGSLVAHELWENVAIIDDFVRDNPYHLPQRCLDIAASWKNALPGLYTLVRYQSGRALLMSEAGVFSVCGVTYELEDEIGPAPAYVEMVLLPFEGLIVYDGFLQAYDVEQAPSSAQGIQDEFENRCAKGIASTAADFIRLSDQHLAAMRDKEFEDMINDLSRSAESAEGQLPKGFHRGVLAGLPSEERHRAVEGHVAQFLDNLGASPQDFDRRVRKREPVSALSGCLSLMTKAQLEGIAQVMGMQGLSRLKKAEMVAELAAELPQSPLLLEARLAMAADEDYELARTLSMAGQVSFGPGERGRYVHTWPIEPYTYLFRGKGGYTALVPDELRPLLAATDFDALDRARRQQKQAVNCMEACVVYCGVVSLDDAYDQYRSLVSDVITREEFGQLAEIETLTGVMSFELWTYLPHDYLVHYTLTPDYVAEEYVRSQRGAWGNLVRNRETGEVALEPANGMASRMRADLASELESLDQFKRELVESRSSLPMRPLSRTLLENDVIGELLDDENVLRLRSYLDARVPDGADDYEFANRVVDAVVMASVESGSLQAVFSYATELGLGPLFEQDERFTLLLTNVFNAMPSWENNGWSPQELYEQVTGRKMFYNDDGTIMKIGADDPCPCGSGKKYRDCCGR